ncbi:MAG: ParB N-terminal domain-containing protein [Caulobacter sp.]
MKLAFADPRNLSVSPLNMHHGRPAPDVSDIAPSIRQRGVLLTLLVLETVKDGAVVEGRYEIVAGARRWHAAMAAIADGVEIDPLPIGIIEAGDDAGAIEASLIENLQRLPPDEVSRWEAFVKLIKEGRTPEQIGATFGMTDAAVNQVLALGRLLPQIRNLYRRDEIDIPTVRALTLASPSRQKEWLAMRNDPKARAPVGAQLRAWLFGGTSIPTRYALFSLDDYPGKIAADLFGQDSYFTDPALFWRCQNEALAARREALVAEGWADVEVLEPGKPFYSWKHESAAKGAGGKVFLEVSSSGEVTEHMGWLTAQEARRGRAAAAKAARAEAGQPVSSDRPEVTANQQAYIDLHRQAAVRAVLTDHPGVALRLLLAHALAGGAYWKVEADPRRSGADCVAQSLEASRAEAVFRERREAVAKALDLDGQRDLVGQTRRGGAPAVFAKLLALSDADVLATAAVVIGETLASGGEAVEAAGLYLKVDTGAFWEPDSAFFELMRDRETVNAMLKEVGGKKVADGNVGEKVKTQKAVLRDCLDGTGGRAKAAKWTPRWLTFPAGAYTKRPLRTVETGKAVAPLLRKAPKPPADPGPLAAE